ncbi:hypothetical protein [Hyphomicrobium sp. DY-1]|uniref:hypothetical protein n=1 Tax=Hyphomicrobium sp. DY-1 TaxID=3075650 RepID=UPI0039C01A52
MMIENTLEFFFDGWGKVMLAIAGFIALITAFALDQRHIGATNVSADLNASAQPTIIKMDNEGAAAAQPGSVGRLRKQYCRDC